VWQLQGDLEIYTKKYCFVVDNASDGGYLEHHASAMADTARPIDNNQAATLIVIESCKQVNMLNIESLHARRNDGVFASLLPCTQIDAQSHLVIFSSRHGIGFRVSTSWKAPNKALSLTLAVLFLARSLTHPCLCALTQHVSSMSASRATARGFVALWHKCVRFTAPPMRVLIVRTIQPGFTKEAARKGEAMNARFRRRGARSQNGNTHLSKTRPCASNVNFESGPFRLT